MNVGEYLERWLADYAKNSVTPKTYERYQDIVRLHLIPALGAHHLSKLQLLHIQSYYSQALQNGRLDGRGGLSPRTVLQSHNILREALQQAVKWQILARNPAEAVEPPRPVAHEVHPLTAEQVSLVLDAAHVSKFYMPVLLAVTTGMRRGEILAVRWQDVDLVAGVLTVRRSLEETKAGLRFKEPKTARSCRPIVLLDIAIEALKHHRAAQAALKLQLGPDYQDQGLVCSELDGRPIRPTNLTFGFRKIARGVGLPRACFHTLRHTHATLLLGEGVHPKIVSERLGHSSIGITMDIYSHVMPTMQQDAARKLNNALKLGQAARQRVS